MSHRIRGTLYSIREKSDSISQMSDRIRGCCTIFRKSQTAFSQCQTESAECCTTFGNSQTALRKCRTAIGESQTTFPESCTAIGKNCGENSDLPRQIGTPFTPIVSAHRFCTGYRTVFQRFPNASGQKSLARKLLMYKKNPCRSGELPTSPKRRQNDRNWPDSRDFRGIILPIPIIPSKFSRKLSGNRDKHERFTGVNTIPTSRQARQRRPEKDQKETKEKGKGTDPNGTELRAKMDEVSRDSSPFSDCRRGLAACQSGQIP